MADKKRNARGELVSDLWRTPQDGFDLLHSIFRFDVDAAAGPENNKLSTWFGPGGLIEDALNNDWSPYGNTFFVNPPYSTEAGPLSKWVAKFRSVAENENCLVVAILPERRNVKWYHDHIKNHAALFEPDHRWAFHPPEEEDSTGPGARQGTMIAVWAGELGLEGSWT